MCVHVCMNVCIYICNCLRLCLAHIHSSTWTGCSLGSLIAGLSFLERVALKCSELKASEQPSIDKVSWRILQTAAQECINNAGTVKRVRKRGRVADRDPVTLHICCLLYTHPSLYWTEELTWVPNCVHLE